MIDTEFALPGYKRILIQQEPRECWAASYGMLLRWADGGLSKEAALDRVKERFSANKIDVKAAENRGLVPDDWPRAAVSLGMQPMAGKFVPRVHGPYFLKGLRTPVVCHLNMRSDGETYLHVVVVVGFDDAQVLFLDPEAQNSAGVGKWKHETWLTAARPDFGAWVPCWV